MYFKVLCGGELKACRIYYLMLSVCLGTAVLPFGKRF